MTRTDIHEASRVVSACGDVLERHGDVLVLTARFPIEGLEPARFRAPILIVDREQFVIVAKDGAAASPRYTFRQQPETGHLYEPDGLVIAYDPDRHLERASERRRTVLAWIVFVVLLSCMPLIGFLPARVKKHLPGFGIDAILASTLSVPLQHLAAAACLVAHFKAGFIFTAPGLGFAALALFIATDAAYRTSEHRDGRAPGLFALAVVLVRLVESLTSAGTPSIDRCVSRAQASPTARASASRPRSGSRPAT